MNIKRQLQDIQIQADRLILCDSDIHDFDDFSKYSEELKQYLLNSVDEEMILKYKHEIPLLDLKKLELKSGLESAIGLFISGLATYFFRD